MVVSDCQFWGYIRVLISVVDRIVDVSFWKLEALDDAGLQGNERQNTNPAGQSRALCRVASFELTGLPCDSCSHAKALLTHIRTSYAVNSGYSVY